MANRLVILALSVGVALVCCRKAAGPARPDAGGGSQALSAAPEQPDAGPPPSAEELAAAGGLFYLIETSGKAQVGRWVPDGGVAVTDGPVAHFPVGPGPGGSLTVIQVEEQGDVHVERVALLARDGSLRPILPTKGVRARHPGFGAEGKVLFFEGSIEGSSELFRLPLDAKQPVRLTRNPEGNFDPNLSPDGSALVFASSRDGQLELYRMNADGSGEKRLTDAFGDDFLPRWSPKGDRIAFISAREGLDRIYLSKPDGTDQRRLCTQPTPSGTQGAGPEPGEKDHAWSPDGRAVVFAARPWGGRFQIWIADLETGSCRRLTWSRTDDDMPALSPDGKLVAFVSALEEEEPQIHAIRVSGSRSVRLTADAGPNWLPTWVK